MDGSRAAKLALCAAKEKATSGRVEIAGGLWAPGAHDSYSRRLQEMEFARFSDDWFELRGRPPNTNSQSSVTIPYGVVSEAWVDAAGTVILLLSVRVLLRDNGLSIEPYV